MSLLNECTSAFAVEIGKCVENIVLSAGLQAGQYKWRITDKFGNRYSNTVAVGENGSLTINVKANLPKGLLNPYAGAFKIEILNEEGCSPQTLTLCEEQYDAIILTVVNDEGESEINIPCCNE